MKLKTFEAINIYQAIAYLKKENIKLPFATYNKLINVATEIEPKIKNFDETKQKIIEEYKGVENTETKIYDFPSKEDETKVGDEIQKVVNEEYDFTFNRIKESSFGSVSVPYDIVLLLNPIIESDK